MWSWSSWLITIQRTSSGSTTENARSVHSSRTSEQPVSTITGSAPRITMLFAQMNVPSGAAAIVGITNVSSVTACGVAGMVDTSIGSPLIVGWPDCRLFGGLTGSIHYSCT
jgi:hypothetical protein